MSRSISHKEVVLASTVPYVDALLSVSFLDGSSSSSTTNSPRKTIVSLFKVHRIILSRLSTYFLNEFKRLETEDEQNVNPSTETRESPALWTLSLTFKGKSEKNYFNIFPSLLDFLYGKPLAQHDVRF